MAKRVGNTTVLLLLACVGLVGLASLSQMHAKQVEEQSLALGGAPDQSRISVVGDASIDTSWRGVWKRTPAAYKAVSRELAGYQDLAATANTVPADVAVARGESILKGYSTVLGAQKAAVRPAANLAKEQKKRLYDSFILRGGRKAQLFDAATHDQELKKYSGVLSFSDKLPAQAIDGPAGKAITSSTDELSGYNSILDFAMALPVFKKTKPVRSHNGVLSFAGSEQDSKQIKKREADHHVLQPVAMAAERDSHKNILSFPDDEDDAKAMALRQATHKILDPASLTAERNSHKGILQFSESEAAASAHKSPPHTLEPQVVSSELTGYDSILEFPGQRQLNQLKDPRHSTSELNAYTGILHFSGHAASSAHKGAATAAANTPQLPPHARVSGAHVRGAHAATTSTTSAPKSQVASKGVGGKGAGSSKRGQRTMLLDEALVQPTTVGQEQPILIEPPSKQDSSAIAKKLAHLYQEAKKLITEETSPKAAAKAAPPHVAPVHMDTVATSTLRAAVPQSAVPQRASVRRKRKSRVEERRISRDPVLRRLQGQAEELRHRLHMVRLEKRQQALEHDAILHVQSHQEKLLKLDEGLEHKLVHKTNRGLKRADFSMAHMIKDDQAKLYKLEVDQAKDKIAEVRRQARQSGMQHLSKAQQKHLALQRDHALLLAKIHQLSKNLPSSYRDGVVGSTSGLHVVSADDSQQLLQLNHAQTSAPLLSSSGKVQYARKLAHAEELLSQARTLSKAILDKSQHAHSVHPNVAKLDKDLEAIAKVLKDRAVHVVLDANAADESLHEQQLHKLMDAALAHADTVLGTDGKATGLQHVLHELRDTDTDQYVLSSSPRDTGKGDGTGDPKTDGVRNKAREQLLRSLLAEEKHRKSSFRRAMTSLHKHVRRPRRRSTLIQSTEAALERSGDYVQPLHARGVLLGHAHARDGVRAEREDETEWQKDLKLANNPDLLSDSSDSTHVLSLQGTADENKALKTDVSALVDATQHSDVKQYDGMLKAAMKKSEKKLASFEAAQASQSREVLGDMASADHVFAHRRKSRPHNAVHEAMASAKLIEKQLHMKFDKTGSIYQLVKPLRKAAHGKHYIAGLGNVHKDNGLISQLWKHHRVGVAEVEALETPKLHTLSKRTHARLTDRGVFKAKGVRRHMTPVEPSAWGIVHTDADTALADGTDVGEDVAEATGWALKGLTTREDSRQHPGDAKANSLWHYV